MLYLLVYGDKAKPLVDVILCDNHPDVTDEGTLVFRNEGQKDFYVYPGDYLSIQHASFGGEAAAPAYLFDFRAGSLSAEGKPITTRRTRNESQ